jgi:hypothetical protein
MAENMSRADVKRRRGLAVGNRYRYTYMEISKRI